MSKEIWRCRARCTVVLLVLFVWTGCGTLFVPGDEKRRASFQPFANLQMGGVGVSQFIQARTAIILAGVLLDSAKTTREGDTTLASYRVGSRTRRATMQGSATAIDPRGYFSTAAHCIDSELLTLIYIDAGTLTLAANVREVWRGSPKAGEPDLALLCIDRPIRRYFAWTPPPPDGEVVIASGMNSRVGSDVTELQSTAGKILDTTRHDGKTPASRFATIWHEAPVRSGDSGGPLLTREGKLIAVTTHGGIAALRPISPPGIAVQPDLDWLRKLINADHVAQFRPAP